MGAILTQYGGTILVCGVLIAIVTLVIVSMIRNKKKGKSSCGCGCSDCPMSGSCHSTDQKDKKYPRGDAPHLIKLVCQTRPVSQFGLRGGFLRGKTYEKCREQLDKRGRGVYNDNGAMVAVAWHGNRYIRYITAERFFTHGSIKNDRTEIPSGKDP